MNIIFVIDTPLKIFRPCVLRVAETVLHDSNPLVATEQQNHDNLSDTEIHSPSNQSIFTYWILNFLILFRKQVGLIN